MVGSDQRVGFISLSPASGKAMLILGFLAPKYLSTLGKG